MITKVERVQKILSSLIPAHNPIDIMKRSKTKMRIFRTVQIVLWNIIYVKKIIDYVAALFKRIMNFHNKLGAI